MIDGLDGSGKSTQCELLAEHLRAGGADLLCVREPGATAVGEAVRVVLLDAAHANMTAEAEACLYMAARAQLVHERIRPALVAGRDVLADRFLSSTVVYQGIAGGMSPSKVMELASVVGCDVEPDLLLVLDLGIEQARRRRKRAPDRMERKSPEFHERVRDGFRRLAEFFSNAVMVDGDRSREDVHLEIRRIVENALR